MVIKLNCNTTSIIQLDEYIDHIESDVDILDKEAVLSSADMLQRLANNKDLLVKSINTSLQYFGTLKSQAATPSTSILGRGVHKDFYVRFNIWPPLSGRAAAIERRLFSYDVIHDHNFNFLTANLHGPGYETEVWNRPIPPELGNDSGDEVELRYQGRFKLEPGVQMYYERGVDIHLQLPPSDYSVSINLMIAAPWMKSGPQHCYDVEKGVVRGFPEGALPSRRVNLIELASRFGGDETLGLMREIKYKSQCRRTVNAVDQAIERLTGADRL